MAWRIVSVVGARPQFIKAKPLSDALQAFSEIEEILVHTGQHYDFEMSGVFFEELQLRPPDVNLEVGSGSHGVQTGHMLIRLEAFLLESLPDLVLVYGDTNSTLAGALAAAKLHIPVAHVEAGLRSFNRAMPEEINRVVADHLSDLLFAPTQTAVENLRKEGIQEGVFRDGDVMADVLLRSLPKVKHRQETLFRRLDLRPGEFLLATVHRAENTDREENLRGIWAALEELARETPLLLPLHPRTQQALEEMGLRPKEVRVLPPVSYLEMLALESGARVILTDSGGVQKEAYLLGVPCVTLREETEWVETVRDGWNVLVGAHPERIIAAARHFLSHPPKAPRQEDFGGGRAAERIAAHLAEWLGENKGSA